MQISNISKVIIPVVIGFCLAFSARATQIQTGYSGSSYGQYQTGNGGEFTLSPYGGSQLGVAGYCTSARDIGVTGSFQTFCIEETEYIYPFPSVMNVAINPYADHVSASGETDPLSQGTGWLYSQFASGNWETGLSYQYGSGRANSAAQLQQAIWMLEDEMATANNIYYDAAMAKFNGGAKNGLASDWGVAALNLTDPGSGAHRQDQLYYVPIQPNRPVPDGGLTVAMLGVAGVCLVALRRRVVR